MLANAAAAIPKTNDTFLNAFKTTVYRECLALCDALKQKPGVLQHFEEVLNIYN